MLKVVSSDNEFYYELDESKTPIINNFVFEFEDTKTNNIYRVSAYSLQDGTDSIRVSFDLLDKEAVGDTNNFNENYEEVAYGFYDDDGNLIVEDAGCDLEDTILQETVIRTIFDHYVDYARRGANPNTLALQHVLNFECNLRKNIKG